jgi:arabinan endo-1,5-alpha-L-arabinosidase
MRRVTVTVLALAVVGWADSGGAGQDSPPNKACPPAGGQNRPRYVHDPSTIVKHKNEYWVFATGRGVASLRSRDLVAWEFGPPVFAEPPKWVTDVVPGQRGHFWAPDVIRHDGRYLLHYSVSAFGKNTSAIALASNPTLDPADAEYKWTDHGIVIRSGPKDDYNAIDPCVVHGHDDTLWMAFGSFWSGIKLVQLDPKTGLRLAPDSPVYALAHKEQIEAVALYRHGEYFYQFVNWGWCCRGVKSTYNIRVGRSREITGPYLDKDGVDLRKGGGSLVLGTEGRFIGPGHAGVFKDGDRYLLSYHFYDEDRDGLARLAIRPLEWDKDGWPRVAGKPITPPAGD